MFNKIELFDFGCILLIWAIIFEAYNYFINNPNIAPDLYNNVLLPLAFSFDEIILYGEEADGANISELLAKYLSIQITINYLEK